MNRILRTIAAARILSVWFISITVVGIARRRKWDDRVAAAIIALAANYTFPRVTSFLGNKVYLLAKRMLVTEIGTNGVVSDENRQYAKEHNIKPLNFVQHLFFDNSFIETEREIRQRFAAEAERISDDMVASIRNFQMEEARKNRGYL